MKKTGAWLVRFALEQIGVRHTFGIPGVHNTEIYDELNNSESIEPLLVTHEGGGAFMADAVSRVSNSIGTLLIVPAAGVTHAASGIGEAFLDGVPMLVIAGGVRSDSEFKYQLHDMDQHALLKPITKATFKISHQNEILETFYKAYEIAISGEPGPVFIEVPVNIQLYKASVEQPKTYDQFKTEQASHSSENTEIDQECIERSVSLLLEANSPGLFLGWGAVDVSQETMKIVDLIGAPASTTLQGLSAFPANHPLHTGMSFGPAAVPASTKAFAKCDAMLAIGTRFGEIGTGSFGVTVPENLIHIDINPQVLSENYPAKVAIQGDSKIIVPKLLKAIEQRLENNTELSVKIAERKAVLIKLISEEKANYREEWHKHDSGEQVNPVVFFDALREKLPDDGFVVVDDGNHTFLTAELMPIHTPRSMISPTDFNCMGYAVPATISTKLMHPTKDVVGIIGDGAFLMTCMEITTAARNKLGAIFVIFNDGELSQISQAQQVPYNRKTCTVLHESRFEGVAMATGADYIRVENNNDVVSSLDQAWLAAVKGKPVIIDVNIDYSKKTRFTKGIVGTNLKRLPLNMKVKMISRALVRKVTG
jgi:acetolactate synthase-1/2/3 large subunit